jgi:hypothetical protein
MIVVGGILIAIGIVLAAPPKDWLEEHCHRARRRQRARRAPARPRPVVVGAR